jgi:hypothetical protein
MTLERKKTQWRESKSLPLFVPAVMPSPQYGISSPQRNNQAARMSVTPLLLLAFVEQPFSFHKESRLNPAFA